jgi:hypothetical protein
MKVGDLIKSKTRHNGQKFLVVGIRTLQKKGAINNDRTQVKTIRIADGQKIRWLNIENWEVISEGR